MSLPLTDDNGVVQTVANGAPVSWSAGLGYDANGLLCVTSTLSSTDVWINGWRRDTQGRLVVSQSSPEGQPFIYNAGWPTDKVTGAIITQQNTPAPTDPRIAGVAVGPLGGVYMTEGGYIWNPLSLWPNGIATPGMWISPRTLTSEWQDYTGTTPVVTPGTVADTSNPVGLALDIRAGAPEVLGPELVTNGGVITDTTGWTAGGLVAEATIAAVDGKLRVTKTPGSLYPNANQTLAVTTGGPRYLLTADYDNPSGLVVFMSFSGTATTHGTATSGTASCIITSGNPSFQVGINDVSGVAGQYIDFYNISVREIPGNHMLQSTSAARPLMSARRNLLTYTEDLTASAWAAGNAVTRGVNTITATGTDNVQVAQNTGARSGEKITVTFKVKKGLSFSIIATDAWTVGNTAGFDGTTGAYFASGSLNGPYPLVSYSCVTDADPLYWLASATFTSNVNGTSNVGVILNKNKVTSWGWSGCCDIGDGGEILNRVVANLGIDCWIRGGG